MFKFLKKLIKRQNNQKGYSLVEYAISSTIIIVLASSGLAILQKKNEANKVRETKEKIAKIEDSIHSFIRANGYVPCPALPNLLESDTNFGRSEGMTVQGDVDTAQNYDSATKKCSNNTLDDFDNAGAVPVKTLHLNADYTYDGWGRKFTYVSADGSGAAADFKKRNYIGNITIVDAKGIHKTNINNPAPNNDGAIYVIISHGSNAHNTAWGKNTTSAPSQATGAEGANTDHSQKTYVQALESENFDDIVEYGTKSQFITQKSIESPIYLDEITCRNAKAMVRKADADVNHFNNITGGTGALLLKNAKKLDHLCENKTAEHINPSKISGLMAWVDASDHATLFGNSGCSTGGLPDNNDSVACWKDKSGNGFHLISSGGNGTYQTNQINGRPSVYLPNSRYMSAQISKTSYPGPYTLEEGMTAFLVLDVIGNTNDQRIFTLRENGQWDGNHTNGVSLQFGNGSGEYKLFHESNRVDGVLKSGFQIITIELNNGNIRAFNNGSLDGKNTYTDNAINPNLLSINGSDGAGANLGENKFAEVIVYDRPLTPRERRKIEHYLSTKWEIPVEDAAETVCAPGLIFKRTAEKPDGDCMCPSGMVQSMSIKANSACYAKTRTSLGGCVPKGDRPSFFDNKTRNQQVGGLRIWLDADDCSTITLDNDGNVEQWRDKSGNGNHASQSTPASRPHYFHEYEKGRSVVDFAAVNAEFMTFPTTSLNNMNAGELFISLEKRIDPPSLQSRAGSWHFSTQGSGGSAHISWTNGKILDAFASTTRKSTPFSNGYPLNQRIVFNITGRSGYWAMWLNAKKLLELNTNTVIFGNTPKIGKSAGDFYFDGNMGEVIIYERSLPQSERDQVTNYLADKWEAPLSPAFPVASKNILSRDLKLWLDAADQSTVYKSATCTGTKSSWEDEVGCWEDKSETNHDATQNNVAERPTYATSAINTKPAIKFDGLNDSLALGDDTLTDGNTPYSAFFVNSVISMINKQDEDPGFLSLGSWSIASRAMSFRYDIFGSNRVVNYWWSNDLYSSNGSITPGTPHVLSFIYDKSFGRRIHVNGTLSNSGGNVDLNLLNNGTSFVGKTRATEYMYGYIGEIIVYERTLPQYEVDMVEGYLADKWAIAIGNPG